MKTIKIIIEKGVDNYGAYATNVAGIYGAGNTAEECKQSILNAIETLKTLDFSQTPAILKQDYELVYQFDTISLLNYYKGCFSNTAFEKLTGINQKQINHYASGHRSPRPAQKQKTESALHALGKELITIVL